MLTAEGRGAEDAQGGARDGAYICDLDLRADSLVNVHGIVIHGDWCKKFIWKLEIGRRLGRLPEL